MKSLCRAARDDSGAGVGLRSRWSHASFTHSPSILRRNRRAERVSAMLRRRPREAPAKVWCDAPDRPARNWEQALELLEQPKAALRDLEELRPKATRGGRARLSAHPALTELRGRRLRPPEGQGLGSCQIL
jgi:hypothetical protein